MDVSIALFPVVQPKVLRVELLLAGHLTAVEIHAAEEPCVLVRQRRRVAVER